MLGLRRLGALSSLSFVNSIMALSHMVTNRLF